MTGTEAKFMLAPGSEEESAVYDEESYDDGYDEEAYDDDYGDGYEGEAYDDYGENYEEETYDSGSDKLGRVLNELAELRRSVGLSGANAVPVQSVAPAVPVYSYTADPGYPYVIRPPAANQNNNNEALIFNEISRLREEIAKTNASQEMHSELSRLKEQLEKDARQNESRLVEEIRRLNAKIEELSGKR